MKRPLVWACRDGAQVSGAVGLLDPCQGGACGAGSHCPHAHSGLGARF